MQDPLWKADQYRKKAARCHELAKSADPAYLGDFYRGVAVRYLFMAEDISRRAKIQGDANSEGSAPGRRRNGHGAAGIEEDFELLIQLAGNRLRSPR
jgi:hypothetical protein